MGGRGASAGSSGISEVKKSNVEFKATETQFRVKTKNGTEIIRKSSNVTNGVKRTTGKDAQGNATQTITTRKTGSKGTKYTVSETFVYRETRMEPMYKGSDRYVNRPGYVSSGVKIKKGW